MTFLAHGYSVRYWPIEYSERAGSSKFHWWTDTRRYLLQVIRMTLSYDPFRVFLPLATLLTVLGLGKLAYDLADGDFKVAINTLLILIGAFQLFVIGMLADLIGRATRAQAEVSPAAGHVRDAPVVVPERHRSRR
jgi:hypothetical protein